MESGLWLLWATLAVSLLYYLTSLRSRSGNARLPPGPRPFPVVGNLLDLRGGNLHHKLACLARVHGPVMRLRLGLTTAVVISSRDAARDAFTRARGTTGVSPRERSRTPPARSDSTSGPWCGYRAPTHAGRTCAASWPRTSSPRGASRRRAASASARWETWCATSAGAPARRWISAGPCTAECSTSCPTPSAPSTWSIWALSRRCRGCARFLEDLVELIAKTNVSDLFPFLRPLDLQGCRRHAASQVAKVLRVLDGIIDRRLDEEEGEAASSNKHGDFLDALLELMSTGKITREDVTTIVFDMFVAGSDTVAITVEWAMAELLRNPSAMAKVREEIQGSLGSKESVEEHDALSLPYLQAVVKEAMRLHPVAPLLLPHQSTEDGVEVGGYAVPRGCTVIFNSWAMMRDPAAWEWPDEFRSERFLDEAIEVVDFRGKDFEFLPFGSGRRVCPGVPMAERVVPFVLASLLHAFEWRLPDGMSVEQLDVSEKFTTANVMAVPLKAVPFVVLS